MNGFLKQVSIIFLHTIYIVDGITYHLEIKEQKMLYVGYTQILCHLM